MAPTRRELLQSWGAAALGSILAMSGSRVAQTAPGDEFSIDAAFAEFMRGIGGTAADAGGRVAFTGRDPILRSHFRIGSAMAIPAMAAAVGAAAIWRERTGQDQDLSVDLRESVYNVNPLVGMILRKQQLHDWLRHAGDLGVPKTSALRKALQSSSPHHRPRHFVRCGAAVGALGHKRSVTERAGVRRVEGSYRRLLPGERRTAKVGKCLLLARTARNGIVPDRGACAA